MISLPVPVSVPNNGNMDNCKDKHKNVDTAKEDHHKEWNNNSDNNKNNDIDKGKDKFFDNNKNIENDDCTKKDKGKIASNNNYAVVVFNITEHRCKKVVKLMFIKWK